MNRTEKRARLIAAPPSARCLRSVTREKFKLQQQQRSHDVENLPPEVLEMVLRFLPYSVVAGPMRLVSKKCCSVATAILNSAFLSANGRLLRTIQDLERSIQSSTNPRDRGICSRARNCLELVLAQYEMLRAVLWRYTHPPREQKFTRLSFYGGAILDELDEMIRMARTKPELLLDEDWSTGGRVMAFTAICKKFMNFFERVSERKVNKSTLVSGCKLVDILDCLLTGRQLLHLRLVGGRSGHGSSVSMRLRYIVERSWFTCLEVTRSQAAIADEDSWRDKQRFMNLRLRRLVCSVNEHHLERLHYEREMLMAQPDNKGRTGLPAPKPPPCSTYSGYGEYAGRFFYYGNMNENAFDNRVIDMWRRNWTRNKMRRKPTYDLVIDVELKCTPELAPLAVRSLLKCDDFDNITHTSHNKPELYLKLNMFCPASVHNRLPGHFVWVLRSPRRH